MNYIQEINAFYVRLETNPLTASAANLWHTLMHVNNRANWINEFSVAAVVLCTKSGLPNSTFKRARAELKEKGYITFTSRGTKAPIYRMISLVRPQDVSEPVGQEVDRAVSQEMSEGVNQVVDQATTQDVSPLLKQKEIKQNETTELDTTHELGQRVIQFYSDHIAQPTKYIVSELICWSDKMEEDLVLEALKRTVENGKSTWRYTLGILHRWRNDGLETVEDVLAAEEAFREKRASQSRPAYARHSGYEDASRALFYGRQPRYERTEVVPDWFRELKEKEAKEKMMSS